MTEAQLDDYLRGDFEYQTVEDLLESEADLDESEYDYTGYFDDLNEEETNIDIVKDDDIKIPEGFKFVAVDGDGSINVFKEKPTIQKGEFDTWRGDGRSEIGQAVWNFSRLPGKPEDSKAAFPEISKILKDYVFEIKDDLDLGAKLDDKGMFKIVFPKYNEIEKL